MSSTKWSINTRPPETTTMGVAAGPANRAPSLTHNNISHVSHRSPLAARSLARVSRRYGSACVLLLACVLVSGCGSDPQLETGYGRLSGVGHAESVNGTSVLAEMFEQAGYRVTRWHRLSPRLDRCDVIVWAPDSRSAPSTEVCEWLENWLYDQPNRTLIYIGRDYEAEIEYWRAMRDKASPEQAFEVQKRLAEAVSRQDLMRAAQRENSSCDWFTIEPDLVETRLDRLRGPWGRELRLDAELADLRIATRLDTTEPSYNSESYWQGELLRESLLYDGRKEVLVSQLKRTYWTGSQILVVDNGCFLLNLPLVNPEKRKLAAHLIEACGTNGQEVVFLETGPMNPTIGKDAEDRRPTGLEAFIVWPINVLMMHLAVLGIVFSVAVFPIFGRPHQPEEETISDFGKHIHALGELLQRAGDETYASQQLSHYHETVRRESGTSHRK